MPLAQRRKIAFLAETLCKVTARVFGDLRRTAFICLIIRNVCVPDMVVGLGWEDWQGWGRES